MNILKSIGAIFVGFLTVAILSIGTDYVLEKLGVTPPQDKEMYMPGLLAVALAYRSLYTIIAGYITANLAPTRPLKHAVILGIIGTVLGIIGVAAHWDVPNKWYGILLAVTALPFTWLGGKIKAK